MNPRLLLFLFLALVLGGCKQRQSSGGLPVNTVVIGIAGDVNSFNPLYSSEVTAGEINELLFPMLVSSEFDTAVGMLRFTPNLARSWEANQQKTDIRFHLASDAKWSDGIPVRAYDVQSTYALYGDPEVGSVWQSVLDGLKRTEKGDLDIRHAIEILDDSTVVFHFQRPYPGQFFDAGLPILPAHVFSKIPKGELRTHLVNQNPTGAAPFRMDRHTQMQDIVLASSPTSTLPYPAKLKELVFRILPEYRSRLLQLRSGNIDIMTGIEVDDVLQIRKESPEIKIVAVPPRRYHFIGWNNIDPVSWNASQGKKIRTHPLFGSANVRRALTMAINRSDLTASLLGEYATEAFGPVSPMFRWAYNDTLKPLSFDPAGAAKILGDEGWTDTNGDGILEKNGKRFSFVLKLPTGNAVWAAVANVVQQRLRDIKIEVRIEQVERSVFWPDLINKKYDAWIAGFEVPLEIKLDDYWGSDLEKFQFNVVSYRNRSVDKLLERIRAVSDVSAGAEDIKQFQAILLQDQPCTFLFWERGRIGVNKRVLGVHSNILATTHDAWDWRIVTEK
jgi:peptide/nickel transport system substrate-binding protein